MLTRMLLLLAALLGVLPAAAQNNTCPNVSPATTSDNRCAPTNFVQQAISANSTHFSAGGVSTAPVSVNAQIIATVSPPVFALSGNPTVTFIAGFSINGPMTLTVAGVGPLNVLKKTTAGLVAVGTGDVVAGQQYLATYDGTQLELQEPSTIAIGSLPPGAASGVNNCTPAAAVASNNLSIAIKDSTGADPSPASPCVIPFGDVTATAGDTSVVVITVPTSFTANLGSTFGTSNNVPFKLWVTVWNNGGTAVLGVSNQTATGNTAPLADYMLASTTACSACATATAAGIIYTTSALTSKAFRILGFAEWGSGLVTAGTWASGPTLVRSFGPGVPRPAQPIRTQSFNTPTGTNNTTASYANTGCTVSLSPTLASNTVQVAFASGFQQVNQNVLGYAGILRGGSLIGVSVPIYTATGGTLNETAGMFVIDSPGTTGSTTWAVAIKNGGAGGSLNLPGGGGDTGCQIAAVEIMG